MALTVWRLTPYCFARVFCEALPEKYFIVRGVVVSVTVNMVHFQLWIPFRKEVLCHETVYGEFCPDALLIKPHTVVI